MGRKCHTVEEIINSLRQAEMVLSQGTTVREAVRQLGLPSRAASAAANDYGGMGTSQAQGLKDLHRENQCLKRIVADQALDSLILKGQPGKRTSPARRSGARV